MKWRHKVYAFFFIGVLCSMVYPNPAWIFLGIGLSGAVIIHSYYQAREKNEEEV